VHLAANGWIEPILTELILSLLEQSDGQAKGICDLCGLLHLYFCVTNMQNYNPPNIKPIANVEVLLASSFTANKRIKTTEGVPYDIEKHHSKINWPAWLIL
jgi:hypothetical protein